MRNANKYPKTPLSHNGERKGKVIQIRILKRITYQKLITSRGSPLAYAYRVWLTSVQAFVSYPACSQTTNGRQTATIT